MCTYLWYSTHTLGNFSEEDSSDTESVNNYVVESDTDLKSLKWSQ